MQTALGQPQARPWGRPHLRSHPQCARAIVRAPALARSPGASLAKQKEEQPAAADSSGLWSYLPWYRASVDEVELQQEKESSGLLGSWLWSSSGGSRGDSTTAAAPQRGKTGTQDLRRTPAAVQQPQQAQQAQRQPGSFIPYWRLAQEPPAAQPEPTLRPVSAPVISCAGGEWAGQSWGRRAGVLCMDGLWGSAVSRGPLISSPAGPVRSCHSLFAEYESLPGTPPMTPALAPHLAHACARRRHLLLLGDGRDEIPDDPL